MSQLNDLHTYVVCERSAVLAHDIAGRIRLRVPSLKGNSVAGEELCTAIEAIEGVAATQLNTLTGSLTVKYDGSIATRDQIFAAISGRGYRICGQHAASVMPDPAPAAVASTVGKAVIEMLLERLCGVAVAALI